MAAHQVPPSLDSPGKNTGVGCRFLLQCMKVKSESEVAQSCQTPSNPMDCSPYMCFIHSCINGHLGCFRILTIVNNAAMKTEVHTYFLNSSFVYFGCVPRSGSFGLYGSSILIFGETSILFSIVVAIIYNYQECMRITFSPHSRQSLLDAFLMIAIPGVRLISHFGFDFHFPDN